jgi:hypothetical protein
MTGEKKPAGDGRLREHSDLAEGRAHRKPRAVPPQAISADGTEAIMSKPSIDDRVDVFSLPVHPWAAMFPMRSDDDLDAMAQSIKANGLRNAVALGMSVVDDGTEPTLCVIDGRNRIAACRLAGVTPHTIMLNGEDQDAYIADQNLERRDLTKGQKAMLVAVRFPDPGKRGRGNKSSVSDDFNVSETRIKNARLVLRYCEQYVPLVIDGSMGLDEAYRDANRKRAESLSESERIEQAARQHAARFKAISARYPDIAEMVKDERLSLDAAEKEVSVRDEGVEQDIVTTVRAVDDVQFHMTYWSKAGKEVLLRVHRSSSKRFPVPDLHAAIGDWINTLSDIQDNLK